MPLDEYVREQLSELLATGEVTLVDEDEPYYTKLASRFPWRFGRIAWDEAGVCISEHCTDELVLERFFSRVRSEIGYALVDPLIILGDNMYFGVMTQWRSIVLVLGSITSLPQHLYVVPPDVSWCVNYTFEDDLYYGRAKT